MTKTLSLRTYIYYLARIRTVNITSLLVHPCTLLRPITDNCTTKLQSNGTLIVPTHLSNSGCCKWLNQNIIKGCCPSRCICTDRTQYCGAHCAFFLLGCDVYGMLNNIRRFYKWRHIKYKYCRLVWNNFVTMPMEIIVPRLLCLLSGQISHWWCRSGKTAFALWFFNASL